MMVVLCQMVLYMIASTLNILELIYLMLLNVTVVLA
nr:MAG TPA: hypothetical protein [Caudoviricetes sp.]